MTCVVTFNDGYEEREWTVQINPHLTIGELQEAVLEECGIYMVQVNRLSVNGVIWGSEDAPFSSSTLRIIRHMVGAPIIIHPQTEENIDDDVYRRMFYAYTSSNNHTTQLMQQMMMINMYVAMFGIVPTDDEIRDDDVEDLIYETGLEQPKHILQQEDIDKLKRCNYKTGDAFPETDCPICITAYNNEDKLIILDCQHYFHFECIEHWLTKENVTCPICRVKVADGVKVVPQISDSLGYNPLYNNFGGAPTNIIIEDIRSAIRGVINNPEIEEILDGSEPPPLVEVEEVSEIEGEVDDEDDEMNEHSSDDEIEDESSISDISIEECDEFDLEELTFDECVDGLDALLEELETDNWLG